MTDKNDRDDGVEELTAEPINVLHEYGVSGGSVGGLGERIDEERERVRDRAEDVVGAVGDEIDRVLADLLGTESRARVYAILSLLGEATIDEVAHEADLPREDVARVLKELEDEGFVELSEGRYTTADPADVVRNAPGRVGNLIRRSISGESTDGSAKARRRPVQGEKPDIVAEYDDDSGKMRVRVDDPGDADYVEVLVNAEVKHEFKKPSAGDQVAFPVEREEAVVARSGCIEDA